MSSDSPRQSVIHISPGYRQTEVGVIPEDWEVETLTSVSKEPMQNGVFYEPVRKGSGVKLINVGDLYGPIPIDSDALELFDATQTECERFRVEEGDLLFTRSSVVPSGIAQCNIYWSSKPEPVVFDSHVIRLRPDTRKVLPAYLFRFCVGSLARHYLVSHAKTGTMTTIDQAVLGKCPAILPTKAEQAAIAEALSDADALIASLEELIAKKRQVKQGAMQELLTGRRRLPGFSGDWETKTLFELADRKKELFDDGDWIEAEFLTERGIRLIQTGNIGEGQFTDKESKKYISSESFTKLACKELQFGDILICRLAEPAGRACILPNIGEERIITSVDVTIFRPLNSVADRRYLVSVFNTRQWFEAVNGRCGGSTRTRISRGELGKIEITIPPLPEQTAIAAILSDMDAEITALAAKLAKARQVKQGMMQELLSGRIRLV